MRLLICVLPILLSSVAQCQDIDYNIENCVLIGETFQKLMFRQYPGAHKLCRVAVQCFKELRKIDPVKYKERVDGVENGELFCDELEFRSGKFYKCFNDGHLTMVRDYFYYFEDIENNCEMDDWQFKEYQQIIEEYCGEDAANDMVKHEKFARKVFCPIDDNFDEEEDDDDANQEKDHNTDEVPHVHNELITDKRVAACVPVKYAR